MSLPTICLSIRQPWAWLILHAGKDVENRRWKTNFRGPVLIHAAKGMTRGEYDDARDFASAVVVLALVFIGSFVKALVEIGRKR